MPLEDYYEDFMMSVLNKSSASMVEADEIFFEDCMKVLIEDGYSFEYDSHDENMANGGYNYTPFKAPSLRIDGYEYVQDRGVIILYLCHFNSDEDLKTITNTEITKLLSNTKKFFENSMKDVFLEKLKRSYEEEAYEVAKFIYDFEEKINQVKVTLITNTVLSKRIRDITIKEDEWFHNFPTTLDIWDIKRFYDNENTQGMAEAIEINFVNEFGKAIPSLSAHLESHKYSSFLCVVPGSVIATLYKKYGARLLEANVRSFLQFRGKVNKGMRNTLKNNPEMFFAYNNGITATAESYELDSDGNISKLKNLQIVNGGQTTATLFHSQAKGFSDLNGVFIQMKLSIIDDESDEEVVPNISRFANTQNRIADSDFFSNHPFHRAMEKKSRRIRAPIQEGQVRPTKWFYERSRGQYQNEVGSRTTAERLIFQQEFPKSQLITKTDLAKIAIIFDGSPNHAIQGAQIAFKYFANNIQKDWERDEGLLNDVFYKRLISQQIMFSECRLLVMEEVAGNEIQPTIAYSLFMLMFLSSKTDKNLDFEKVWEVQSLYSSMQSQLIEIIDYVVDFFSAQTIGIEGRNVFSFSRSIECLNSFKSNISSLDNNYLNEDYLSSLISNEDLRIIQQGGVGGQDVENEVEIFEKLSGINWDEALDFARNSTEFYGNDIELLSVFPSRVSVGMVPTTPQIFAINRILLRMIEEGFDV